MYQALQKATMKNSKQTKVFIPLVNLVDMSCYILSKEGIQGTKWILAEIGIFKGILS